MAKTPWTRYDTWSARAGYSAYGSTNGVADPGLNQSSSVTRSVGPMTNSGIKDPDWKLAVDKDQNATNNYTRNSFVGFPGFVAAFDDYTDTFNRRIRRWGRLTPCEVGNSPPTVPSDTALSDQALLRLKRKLRSGQVRFNAPLFAAESRELGKLIPNLATAVTNVLTQYGNLRKSTKGASGRNKGSSQPTRVQALSQAWLGLSFGVNPLISEVNGLVDTLYKLTSDSRKVRYTGTASKSWFSSNKNIGLRPFMGGYWVDQYLEHTLSYRWVSGWSFPPRTTGAEDLLSQFMITPESIPLLFYELTPYTWAIDYFTTIGQCLEDLAQPISAYPIYLMRNVRYRLKIVERTRPNIVTTVKWHDQDWIATPGEYEFTHFSRTSYSNLPSLSLRFKTPEEIAKNALSKVLNLTSILLK